MASTTSRWNRLVAAVAVLSQAFVLRGVGGPFIYADELGYVAAARYFGFGQPDIQMLSAFYHFGYGLLLAPLTMVFTEPAGFYRAATIFNGLLAVSATLVFYRIVLRRFLEIDPATAAVAAIAFALAPSLLVNTSILWAETALAWMLTLTLAAVMAVFRSPTVLRAALAGGLGAFAYGLHPRAIAVTAALIGTMLVAGAVRAMPIRVAFAGMASAVVGTLVVRAVNATMRDALYTEGSIVATAGGLLEDKILEEPGQWVMALAGTAWYQLLASLGLVALGVAFWIGEVWGIRRGEMGPAAGGSLFLGGCALSSWLVGSVIGIDPIETIRIDQTFYGRYIDFVAPLAIGFGVVLVQRAESRFARWSPLLALSLPALGWVLAAVRGADFYRDRAVVRVNVPVANALEVVVNTWSPARLGLIGGLVSAGVLLGFRWRREVGVVGLAIAMLSLSYLTLDRTTRPASQASAERTSLAEPIERLAGGGTVFLAGPYEVWTLYGLQYWADDVWFALETDCPTSARDVVIATPGDPRFADWFVAGSDPGIDREIRQDLTGASATSRSMSVEVVAVSRPDADVAVDLVVRNLDDHRPLVLGPASDVVLHVRWMAGGEPVDVALPVELELSPGDGQSLSVFFSGPEPGSDIGSVDFDAHAVGAGWLGASPCQQSQFGSASVPD
ncbi:MAG: hypothetical protein ACI8TP_002870 [Acidimicrobiales bacterium]